jgi:uncharacterized GH25 family protein
MRQVLVLGWSLILTVTVLGQQSRALTLVGKVVDSNARPVGGAEVAIYEELYDYSMGQEYAQLLDRIKRTDANGFFVLNATIGSRYGVYVVARKQGLALGWDVLTQGARDKDDSTVIILERPCISAGIVVDQAGNPVAGARVRAVPKTSYLRRLEQSPILAPEQWLVTQTDDKGNFRFDDFAADVSADFWVEAPGWSSVYQYTTHWVRSCGFEAGRTDIRLVLPKEVPIRGTVIDAETGKPVEGAHVVTRPDNIKEHANPYCPSQTISEQDGQFRFKGVPPGKHSINVSIPLQTRELVDKRVKLDVQADEDLKEITVALDKGGLIEIIAREEGTNKPIGNLPIYFWQAIQDEHSTFYKDAKTGQDGMLRIWAPPGECKLSARCDGYLPQTYDNQVLVAKGQTANLEIVLDNYPSVSGLVLDETGQPASGVLVKALPAGQEALTDQAGRFEVGFDPSSPCEKLVARYIERNLAAIVDVKDYSKPVKVALKPALSITGQVTDPKGVGISAARLALWLRVAGMLTPFGSEMITDSQGRYEIKAVPPEQPGFEYRVSVNSSGYGNKEFERISITGEPGTEVEMKTLILQPADQSLSGAVVDPNGKPAAGVPIFLHGTGQPIRNTATDNNGRFIIKRICKGPLRLQADFDSSPGGAGLIKAEGGDQNVKIILGQERVHTKYISLTGRQLPHLKEFKIDPSSANTGNKMILVCFFDMNQRPSRNCLVQLSKRAQELKAKDVVVIAIQASEVDENTLNEWIKTNNISFPVGMIQDDAEKIRFAWGVRSLPWLILSDPEHIVRAEGFALSDLDEKIKENEPSANAAVGSDKVTGLVKDPNGQVLSNVRVTEFQTDKEYITDADGKFVSAFGVSGNTRYFFAVHRQRKLVGVGQLPAGQRHVEINLVSAKIVSGRVIDPNGRPVVGATVEALPVGVTYVLTDAQGEFDIGWDSKQAGDLFLMVRHVQGNLAGLFDISAKQVQVQFRLGPALTLIGKVTDPDDKPISGARVGIGLRIEAFTTGVAGLHGILTSIRSTSTDDKGRFELKALPQKQEWIIYTSAEDNGYVDRRVTTGIINTITDREDIGQIILKKPNQFVSGIVVDNAGKPVANCRVGVQGEGQPERTTETDAQGKFTLEKICVGSIEIWAKLDSVLYGTVEAQAGRKDVKLVVLPIR